MFKITKEIDIGTQKEIEIVPFGDIHFGSTNCRIDKFKRLLEWVKSKNNVYLIGMGDYLDCIIPIDERSEPNEESPYENINDLQEKMLAMLTPIKDRILCLLMGNHEDHLKKDGFGDPTKHFCNRLGIPYGGMSSYLKIRVKQPTHKADLLIWTHHGWFAGRKRGAKVNNLEDNLASYEADVFLAGHSHDLWATRKSRIYWKGAKDIIFANTGSFVETSTIGTTNYSEKANYPPQKLGVVKLKWLPYKGKVYISE